MEIPLPSGSQRQVPEQDQPEQGVDDSPDDTQFGVREA
jgi:hypothetical protein